MSDSDQPAGLRAAIRVYRMACAEAAALRAKHGEHTVLAYAAARHAEGIATALRCFTHDLDVVNLPTESFRKERGAA